MKEVTTGNAQFAWANLQSEHLHGRVNERILHGLRARQAVTVRCASATTNAGKGDYFSRTIVKEPARAAGRTTHPEFRVALQPSPRRVVPSSVPITGTDSVAPSEACKTPSLASRRPH